MPIIKSAKKQLRQNKKRRARNSPVRNELKTTYKKALTLIKEGKLEEAKTFLPFAYKIIDMAAKKKLIHNKNAANKKSRIALALNELEKKGGKVEAKETVVAKEETPAPVEVATEETKAE